MVKKMLLALVMVAGFVSVPRTAMAGCTTDMADCYERAAKIERLSAGIFEISVVSRRRVRDRCDELRK